MTFASVLGTKPVGCALKRKFVMMDGDCVRIVQLCQSVRIGKTYIGVGMIGAYLSFLGMSGAIWNVLSGATAQITGEDVSPVSGGTMISTIRGTVAFLLSAGMVAQFGFTDRTFAAHEVIVLLSSETTMIMLFFLVRKLVALTGNSLGFDREEISVSDAMIAGLGLVCVLSSLWCGSVIWSMLMLDMVPM